MRSGKELLIATKPYAKEQRWRSWWHFWSTIVVAATCLIVASMSSFPWYVCLISSLIGSLTLIRLFIVYHDYMHGAILNDSFVAGVILKAYGTLVLSPPYIWKHSHDEHHKNNARKFGPVLGTFPVLSTEDYAKASRGERLYYSVSRHPLTILGAYFTVFAWDMCLHAFLIDPKKHFDGLLAIVIHICVAVALGFFVSLQAMFLGFLLPMAIITCMGAYLFYAQHNFPGVIHRHGEDWDHVQAALHSSSFMKMGPIMKWFTGNIGYHHVHHLNAKIPFYRLPEAMAGLEELQSPTVTSLHPADVLRCLRLKLWDGAANRLMSFSEARKVIGE